MKLKQYDYKYLFKEYEKFVYKKYTSLSRSEIQNNLINDLDLNDFKESVKKQFKENIKTIQLKNKNGKIINYDYYKKINTDVRNYTRIEAFNKQEDYFEEQGIEIFKISSHSDPRAKCEPYQDKYFSRNGESGFLEIAGKIIEYSSLSDTSYGALDGLFGINCRHIREAVDPSLYLERKVEEKIDNIIKKSPTLYNLLKLGITIAALYEAFEEEEQE